MHPVKGQIAWGEPPGCASVPQRPALGFQRRLLAFAFAATTQSADPVLAQDAAVVIGIVGDTARNPLAGVEVVALRARYRSLTDGRGIFVFHLPAGDETFLVRRVGFGPQSFDATLVVGDTVRLGVILAPAPVTLPELAVEAENTVYRGKLAGFAERMTSSGAPRSSFLTRRDIEQANATRTTDLLRRAGLRLRFDRRGQPVLTCPRGRSTRQPVVGYFLDGARAPANFDISYLDVNQIEAIEVYPSTANRPMIFNLTGTDCVVALWLREGLTSPP